MKFMVTFVPIFLAFMVGMYNLYWYYDPSVRGVVEIEDHKTKTNAQENFGKYAFLNVSPYTTTQLRLLLVAIGNLCSAA